METSPWNQHFAKTTKEAPRFVSVPTSPIPMPSPSHEDARQRVGDIGEPIASRMSVERFIGCYF